MDFLNKAYAQLTDLFRSMTPGARITAGLLLAVVVVSLGYLFSYHISPSDEYLFNGQAFTYQHLERIQLALGKAGIESTIDNGRIRVPRGLETKALGALADANALPPRWNQSGDQVIENDSPFVSDKQRDYQRERAREKDLATVIEAMEGVVNANVEYDEATTGRFPKTTLRTVAISLATEPGYTLTNEQVNGIRSTAVKYFAGTKTEDVNIWDVNGRNFPGSLESAGGAMGDTYSALKRQYETDWRNKIFGLIDFVPGLTVETTVTLSDVRKLVTRTMTPDKKGTPVRTMEKIREQSQEGPTPAGRPGFASNQPAALPPANLKGSSETISESETTEDSLVGAMEKQEEQVPMVPTRVQAVVGVPVSYFEKLWRDQNPTPPGEEPKKPTPADLTAIETQEIERIEQMVAGLLPEVEGVADKKQLVTVKAVRPLAPTPLAEPALSESFLFWVGQHWTTLGMLGVAGFSLLMLRSMVRSAVGEPRVGTARVAGAESSPESEGEEKKESGSASRLSRFAKSGASLRDELSDLVREDTEAAANILRAWIGATPGKS